MFLPVVALFDQKIKLFVRGRKNLWADLQKICSDDVTIWVHCASLGEFEQGRPVMEGLKGQYPNSKILLTFFSPSGYQVQKNYALADVVTYLPLDLPVRVKRFLNLVKPDIALFIKYEFWLNYLYFLHKRKIPTLLISAIFRKNQIFFKPLGKWMQPYLKTFAHCFVQNETSKKLLQSIGYNQSTICGDTRFDRVETLLHQPQSLPFIQAFKGNKTLLVAGSTWPKDQQYLMDYINGGMAENEKILIAPHKINAKEILNIEKKSHKKTIRLSQIKNKNLQEIQVLILDKVGILAKVYRYADMAYVGGGYTKDGIHNILEPAVYGLPIVIGKNYQKFAEALDLVRLKGCTVVYDSKELSSVLERLYKDSQKRKEQGNINRDYVIRQLGATQMILDYIDKNLL